MFGEDAYPALWEKAAALLHSLAGHPFADGNKRCAWLAAATFLEVNGHPLDPAFRQAEAGEVMVAVAEGTYRDVAAIAAELVKFFT